MKKKVFITGLLALLAAGALGLAGCATTGGTSDGLSDASGGVDVESGFTSSGSDSENASASDSGKNDSETNHSDFEISGAESTEHIHVWGEWTETKPAACEEEGEETRVCKIDSEHTETREIPALEHDLILHEGKAATCTESGWETYTECSRGDYTTYKEIFMLGHDWADDVCTRCGAKLVASEGLAYELSDDGSRYTVSGIGTCTDTDIVIPSTHDNLPVTSIGERAFSECSGLTSVTIGNGVTSIGWHAFYGCSGLTSIVISDSVADIGWYAFYGCSKLTSVSIGRGVTNIGGYAFRECSSLKAVYYKGNIALWCGISFGYNDSNPLVYAHNLYINYELVTDLVIPDGVTSIGSYAFSGCSGLKSVSISKGVTSIGSYAFSGCSGLTGTLTIPNGVKSIDSYAFFECVGLTNVVIPDSVISVGYDSFRGCGVTGVVIGSGVESIGERAFFGCDKLTNIEFKGTMAEWNAISKKKGWDSGTGNYTVICTDGVLDNNGKQIA